MADTVEHELWIPYSNRGQNNASANLFFQAFEARINPVEGYGTPLALPNAVWGPASPKPATTFQAVVDDACVGNEANDPMLLRAYTGAIEVPGATGTVFSPSNNTVLAGSRALCGCSNAIPTTLTVKSTILFDNALYIYLLNNRDTATTVASAECVPGSGQIFARCETVRCTIFPR